MGQTGKEERAGRRRSSEASFFHACGLPRTSLFVSEVVFVAEGDFSERGEALLVNSGEFLDEEVERVEAVQDLDHSWPGILLQV